MNLEDYLDAALTVQRQSAAPIARRTIYTAQAPRPVSMASSTPLPQSYVTVRPGTYQLPPVSGSLAPVAIPPPPAMLLPGASYPPPSSESYVPTTSGPFSPAPPPSITVSPPPSQPVVVSPETPPPPGEGGEASGDSGSLGAGYGWILIAVGGYLLYQGLK